MSSQDALLALALLLTGIGAAGATRVVPEPPGWRIALWLAPGLFAGIAGYIAKRRRPENRTGTLLAATGIVYLIPFAAHGLLLLPGRASGRSADWAIGSVTHAWYLGVAVYLALSFPTGRLLGSYGRVLVAVTSVSILVIDVAWTATYDHRQFDRTDPDNPLLVYGSRGLNQSIGHAKEARTVVLAAAVLASLVYRRLHGSPTQRRALAAIFFAGVINAVVFGSKTAFDEFGSAPWLADFQRGMFLLLPLAFLVGLLQSVLARGGVASLVVELRATEEHDALERSLARALGDPTAELVYGRPTGGFVDAAGRAVTVPPPEPHRTATVIEGMDGPIAALVHDEVLVQEPELLEAVAAAARLGLENRRLEQEIRLRRAIPSGLAERLRREGRRVGEVEALVVSVVMSDVRGFSTIAERADPRALASQLNEHRVEMNAVIVAEGGTVMQTAGDSVFAVFGAPLPLDDHAERAVRAALRMHESQAALNERWSLEQRPPFGLGIAVTGGEVAAALLGSEDHVEYSIVGDVVNLAQRIQQWAHAGETILSKTTYDAVRASYPEAAALSPAAVKGRETLVRGYRLGGRATESGSQAG